MLDSFSAFMAGWMEKWVISEIYSKSLFELESVNGIFSSI
jgi:hypothetical protein